MSPKPENPGGDAPGQQKQHSWAQVDPTTGAVIPDTQVNGTQAEFRARDKSLNYVKVDPLTGQPLPEDPADAEGEQPEDEGEDGETEVP